MSDSREIFDVATDPPVAQLVTVLFTDIEGSTELARRLGPAGWREALGDHHRIIEEAIAGYGGRVVRTEGDAFLAFFPDATAAVLAAVEAQRGLARHQWQEGVGSLKVRMGLHTGVVERHHTGYVGLDLHLAARVAAAANGGQILVTAATRRLLGELIAARNLGEHRLKDFPEPERLYHVFVDASDVTAVPAPRTASVRPTNLPPQTRALVGRDRELAELRELLGAGSGSIVTITGTGGIGKTRLAVAVAADLLEQAPGGVFMVRLAGTRDPGSIVPMIAEAVGITGEPDEPLESLLAQRLGERRTILILDNFEQLVAGASIVTNLAANAHELRVLITSQVPLRISAEQMFPLGPLASEDAAGLFIERARARDRDFDPGEDELATIDDICERLDSMPLAIELAAARVGSLGTLELHSRLERPLALLTRGDLDVPERQRSLRAAIQWTYELLDPGQQSLFERLGVCAGPVPLGTVEAIADRSEDPQATLDQLDALLESSLVRRLGDRRLGIRFLMPQALRDYALEQLAAAGDEESTRRQHAEHVATLAHAAQLWKWGATAERRTALLAIGGEIRAAVAWAREHDPELHVRLCAGLAPYWVYRGVISEVAEELRRARDSGLGSTTDRAWTATLLAKCVQLQSTGENAIDLADQALVDWRQVADERERAVGLGDLSWAYRWASRPDVALSLMQEALAILRRTRDSRLILRGLVFMAHALVDIKDVSRTQRVLEEAAELAGEDPTWELDAIRGDCALDSGDYAEAIKLYARSLAWTSQSDESHQVLMDLRALWLSLAAAGHAEAALEVSELTRLREDQTGRVGLPPEQVLALKEAASHARELAGIEGTRAAIARARDVAPAMRIQRALEVSTQAADLAAPSLSAVEATSDWHSAECSIRTRQCPSHGAT